jgi:hypothetical protein
MSWDIALVAIIDYQEVEIVPDINYTHNTNRMIRQAGFTEWPDVDGMPCPEFCRKLSNTLTNLQADPDRWRAMNPPNGWGSYDSLVPVLESILANFGRFPSGTVRCSA